MSVEFGSDARRGVEEVLYVALHFWFHSVLTYHDDEDSDGVDFGAALLWLCSLVPYESVNFDSLDICVSFIRCSCFPSKAKNIEHWPARPRYTNHRLLRPMIEPRRRIVLPVHVLLSASVFVRN